MRLKPAFQWDYVLGVPTILCFDLGYERPATSVEASLIREMLDWYREAELQLDWKWQRERRIASRAESSQAKETTGGEHERSEIHDQI
jgi:hypothetical protein